MTTARRHTPLDEFIIGLDQGLRTLFGRPRVTDRPYPAADLPEAELDPEERRKVAGLVRVDHSGEVCAQALYQGQALTAKLPRVRERMEQAAREENDHLAWCERRLQELEDRKSLLNPLWYMGAFSIGALAGLAGDKWSLGFVVETERQVEAHLEGHLRALPSQDHRTRAVLEQMKEDEIHHADGARAAGGAPLPLPVRMAMRVSARVMTGSAYWL